MLVQTQSCLPGHRAYLRAIGRQLIAAIHIRAAMVSSYIITKSLIEATPPTSPGSPARCSLIIKSLPGAIVLASAIAAAVPATAQAQTVTEFPLAANSLPIDITAGLDGALWFTQSNVPTTIGHFTTGGTLTSFRIPTPVAHSPEGITAPDRTGPCGSPMVGQTR